MIKVTTKGTSWGYSEKKDEKGKDCGWSIISEYMEDILPYNMRGTYEIEVGGHVSTAEITISPYLSYDKHNDTFKEYFEELYWIEQNQIKEENKMGISHEDQLVDLGISYDALSSSISNEYIKSNDFSITMNNIDSFISDGGVMLSKGMYEYSPLKDVVICTIKVSNIFANAKLRFKFRMFNYLTDEIKEYLINLKENNESSFELKIKNFVPFNNFTPKFNLTPKNYEIIPIGANWTDNTNIIGYHNVITDDYQSTPSFDLIKYSKLDYTNPYFLILDEMNLSHVERYFADFLSAIESDEEIPLYGTKDSLKLPKNLFIIGTVNVDETTYMFSPKVLDRANTIEFNTLTAYEYMIFNLNDGDFEGNIEYLQSPLQDFEISNMDINKRFRI